MAQSHSLGLLHMDYIMSKLGSQHVAWMCTQHHRPISIRGCKKPSKDDRHPGSDHLHIWHHIVSKTHSLNDGCLVTTRMRVSPVWVCLWSGSPSPCCRSSSTPWLVTRSPEQPRRTVAQSPSLLYSPCTVPTTCVTFCIQCKTPPFVSLSSNQPKLW